MYFGISGICQRGSSILEALKRHESTNQCADAAPAGGDGIPLVLSAKEVGPGQSSGPRSHSRGLRRKEWREDVKWSGVKGHFPCAFPYIFFPSFFFFF